MARMKETPIRLPTNHDGTVDWEYMESVMRGLPFSAAIAETNPTSDDRVGHRHHRPVARVHMVP